MFGLDVAVVGFVIFGVIAPFFGGYLVAWLLDGSGSHAMVAVLGGGTDGPAIAAAIGGAVAVLLTLRFTAGAILDSFIGAWPENRALLTDPRLRLANLNSRFARDGGDEIVEDGPLGLGAAAGWLGSTVAAVLFAGMSLADWPQVAAAVLARVGAGTGSAPDWLVAAFPIVARTLIASILGILAGAIWSIFGGPVRQMESLDEDIKRALDDRSIVDAPPTNPRRG